LIYIPRGMGWKIAHVLTMGLSNAIAKWSFCWFMPTLPNLPH
jgi:hypothetical protein